MDIILNKLMDFLHENNDDMDAQKAEIVKYGLEILLLKVSFSASALVIGALMQSFLECLFFILLFSAIRSFAGGYHAKTRLQCFIQSMLTFASVLEIIKLEKMFSVIIIPLLVLALFSAVIIFTFAPIDTENKRLDKNECNKFRYRSRIAMSVEIVICLCAYFLNFSSIACSVMLALIVTGTLMVKQLIKDSSYIARVKNTE